MVGLVPVIHVFIALKRYKEDARYKAEHDGALLVRSTQ